MSTPTLTLIGGPTVLIELDGWRLLTDPTFDAPGVYHARGIELEKTRPPARSPAELGPIDAVLLSHDQHLDNLDRAGRAFLSAAPVVFSTTEAARRLEGLATPLQPGETVMLGEPGRSLLITGTPARHGPFGVEPISGDVIGFLVGERTPGDAVYVTGDTVWYGALADLARRCAPQVVIPFAGAARPRGPFRMTMDCNEVVELACAFPDARIAPAHVDSWSHFTESRSDIAKVFAAMGLAHRLVDLEPGSPTFCA